MVNNENKRTKARNIGGRESEREKGKKGEGGGGGNGEEEELSNEREGTEEGKERKKIEEIGNEKV